MTHLAALKAQIVVPGAARCKGTVVAIRGPVVTARIPRGAIGDLCRITRRDGSLLHGQIISFNEDLVSIAPFEESDGIMPGAAVEDTERPLSIVLGEGVLGSVLNAFGEPMQNPHEIRGTAVPISGPAPAALARTPIRHILETGVKAIDCFCSIGYGQRIGLLAGAGTGKSTLLGMIARNADVDVTVIGLVGERGREVQEFIEESLGETGLKRAVVVVATSDEAPIRRALAAESATAIADFYRAKGKRVLLLIDSLTRVARAIREVGLAAGEVPIRQGFTPSVYSKLPRLLERAGTSKSGSITAIYTILTNGEGESDPLAEEIKSLLDGHLILSPHLANQGIRPAVDITMSLSRLAAKLQDAEHRRLAAALTNVLARLKRDKDLILLGGTPDPELQQAIDMEPALKSLLMQAPNERVALSSALSQMKACAGPIVLGQ